MNHLLRARYPSRNRMIGVLLSIVAIAMLIGTIRAQYDSIKNLDAHLIVTSSDDCMLAVSENITFSTSAFGVTSFERSIPTTTFPTSYSWITKVKANIVAQPPQGFTISNLNIYQTNVKSSTDLPTIIINFSALDSLPKNTLLNLLIEYHMLGPIGFKKNATGFERTILDYPLKFSTPVEKLSIKIEYPHDISSTPLEPFLKSNAKYQNSALYSIHNTTMYINSSLAANELFESGFVFDSSAFHICYIPFNLMEGSTVGIIIGSTFATPVLFFLICGIVTIVRYFVVERNKVALLDPAHRV